MPDITHSTCQHYTKAFNDSIVRQTMRTIRMVGISSNDVVTLQYVTATDRVDKCVVVAIASCLLNSLSLSSLWSTWTTTRDRSPHLNYRHVAALVEYFADLLFEANFSYPLVPMGVIGWWIEGYQLEPHVCKLDPHPMRFPYFPLHPLLQIVASCVIVGLHVPRCGWQHCFAKWCVQYH